MDVTQNFYHTFGFKEKLSKINKCFLKFNFLRNCRNSWNTRGNFLFKKIT